MCNKNIFREGEAVRALHNVLAFLFVMVLICKCGAVCLDEKLSILVTLELILILQ